MKRYSCFGEGSYTFFIKKYLVDNDIVSIYLKFCEFLHQSLCFVERGTLECKHKQRLSSPANMKHGKLKEEKKIISCREQEILLIAYKPNQELNICI